MLAQSPSLAPPVVRETAGFAWLRHLSLDVVAGIVGAGGFALSAAGMPFDGRWLAFLGLSAWLVYAIDHLWDGYRCPSPAAADHHRFFQRHRGRLTFVICGLAAVNLGLATQLPGWLLLAGLPVLGLIALHLVSAQSSRRVPKELSTTVIYTSAVWLPVWGQRQLDPSLGAMFLAHAGVAFANLIFISRAEIEVDRRDGGRSAARSLGRARSAQLVFFAATFAVCAALIAAVLAPNLWGYASVVALLALWPGALLLFADTPRDPRRARGLADASLLLFWLALIGVWA